MRTKVKLLMWLVLIVGSTNAWGRDIIMEPGDYRGNLGLVDYDTLLMTGGKIEDLLIGGYAVATIYNTDLPYGVSYINNAGLGTVNIYGGEIGEIEAIDTSIINMTGGSIDYLKMQQASISYLYGGQINTLASDQLAIIPNTTEQLDWIHIFCLPGYSYDDNTNILSGQWEDGTAFDITLQDIGTYPTYDVIEFHIIPEPGAIMLLGLGGIFLKRRINNYMRL